MTPKSKSKWLLIPFILFLLKANVNAQTCTNYTETPGTTITTAGNTTYSTTINVPDNFILSDVNITVNITHSWNEDLDIFLISPTGTRVELLTDNGGNGDDIIATFDDASGNSLPTGNSSINGTYKPEGSLSDFNSENSSGNWVLEVTDDTAQDGGSINSVTLNLCYAPLFSENFESGATWSTTGTTAPRGGWINIDPNATTYQLEDDHTPTGTNALITGQNTNLSSNDVDRGIVVATSPSYTVNSNADLSIWYFFGQRDNANDSEDFFKLEISLNNGSSWSDLVNIGDIQINPVWTEVTAAIPAGSVVLIRATASDGTSKGDIIEAGLDDLSITESTAVKIPITVTADSKTKSIGEADPNLTYTITSGSLESGDTLTGSLSRNSGEAIGTYTINQGTLNNPKYLITYISAQLTIAATDTDGDGYTDDADIDDDNDGILDTDENCIIPGSSLPAADAENWQDTTYSIFGIGNNTNGLGYQESGFQQAAYTRGINLTVLDDSSTNYVIENPTSSSSPKSLNDRVYFGINPTTSSNDGVVSLTSNYYAPDYDGGSIGCSSNPNGRNSELRTTASSEFTSGGSSTAIYVVPERGSITGNSYSININFTSSIYAFSFDINDIFDTTSGTVNPTYELEVFADGKLLAYLKANNFGNDTSGNMQLYRGDKTTLVNGAINIGNQTEATIGFINSTAISNVEIRTTIISGDTGKCARDAHGLDSFAYGTSAQSCFADDLDFDRDGITNDKDLDSDNDGIPDNVEAQSTIDYIAPNYTYSANGLDTAYPTGLSAVNTDGTGNADYTDLDSDGDAIFDTVEVDLSIDTNNDGKTNGTVGKNGLDNALYALDDFKDVNANINDPKTLKDTDNDALTIGDVDYKDTHLSGKPMITQIYIKGTSRVIEITNIDNTNSILANTIELSLYKNKTGDQTSITPNNFYTITSELAPGESILINNNTSSFSGVKNDGITALLGADDILVLSHPMSISTGVNDWKNRYETIFNLPSDRAYVRSDEVTISNKDFATSEWVTFVNDDLDPYRDLASGGPERHPHDPLISEIANADATSNLSLGVHKVNPTIRVGNSWSNGTPDRSRRVIINENFTTSSPLKARELTINSGQKLTVTDNVLIVSNDISLTDNTSEIRLSGTAQLIQNHSTTSKTNGSGKLYIDQNSLLPSTYRYNYMSSPVGGTSYTVADVLKDGTQATSATSTPININFVGGYNGETSSPIKIADYWIYTYASANGSSSHWAQKKSTGSIPVTDGFTIKGPGQAQNYTFVGTPNDGDLTTAIGANESYLVGNPYPSAISAKKFIEDNSNSIDGTLYFWQHAGEKDISSSNTAGHSYNGYIGGYSTRNISMGLAANQVSSNDNSNDNTPSLGNGSYTTPQKYIAVAQGFFISGDADGGPIVFNNSQREYITEGSESVFFKSDSDDEYNRPKLPIIKLGMDYSTSDNRKMHRQIGISFNPNNSFVYDVGYDSYLFDLSATDIYWKFPNNNDEKYAIAGVNEITAQLQVPLEIVLNKDDEITIQIDEWNLRDQDIYLYDSFTEISYPLKDNKATLSLDKGTYENRFFLAFSEKKEILSSSSDNFLENNISIFYHKKDKEINVNPKNTILIQKAELYSILGKKINSWKFSKNEQLKLKVNSLSKAVYILNLNTDKGKISKKLIIN